MDIEQAARLYSALNVVVSILRGTGCDDPGLIVRLEQAASTLQKATDQFERVKDLSVNGSGVDRVEPFGSPDDFLKELTNTIRQVLDDTAGSAVDLQSDKIIQTLQLSAGKIAKKAAQLALENKMKELEAHSESRQLRIYRWSCIVLSALTAGLTFALVAISTG